MTYEETINYIEEKKSLGSVFGLKTIRELLRRLGNPQKSLSFVHIAGTNGKGSVLAMISTVLKEGGYCTGRYFSPSVFRELETIQVGNRPISKKCFAQHMTEIRAKAEEMVLEGFSHPTVFEMEIGVAFCYFVDKNCDIVLLETGLGGKMDATNVIESPILAIFTSISMDHMNILGDRLEQISKEKAGILKKGCLALTIRQREEVMHVLKKEADNLGCPLAIADVIDAKRIETTLERQVFSYKGEGTFEISLAGTYQLENAVLAIEALRLLERAGFPVSQRKIQKGLSKTKWQGRFSVLSTSPLFIIDGAHNFNGAKKLAESIEFYFTNKKIIYIMGILKDKDDDGIIRMTEELASDIITVSTPERNRTIEALELACRVRKYHQRVSAADSLEEAVEMAYLLADKQSVIIAFGSLSFLGKIKEIVKKKRSVPNGK
ncbi:MAG: bifunctional folylpolyglutamate synthase/dihydrofolate synthase [Lachnospiraceae bacterium]|nr:bifunctional folylpolyglutamate synthase/dihydrofolate synthase [Lachnospiraceae bacterium]